MTAIVIAPRASELIDPWRPVLAWSRWTPLHGDPAADERGRWVTEDADGQYLSTYDFDLDSPEAVADELFADLREHGIIAATIAVDLTTNVITAYGPEQSESSRPPTPGPGTGEVDAAVRGAAAPTSPTETPRPLDASPGLRTGAGCGDQQGGLVPADPPSRAEVLRFISARIDAYGLPVPLSIGFTNSDRRDLTLRMLDDRPDDVHAWAKVFGFAVEWRHGRDQVFDDTKPWRSLGAEGTWEGWPVNVWGLVHLSVDSSGLEGTGWLDEVWIATKRQGLGAHRPTGNLTACARSMVEGYRMPAAKAHQEHQVAFTCRKCWPNGSPITSPEGW